MGTVQHALGCRNKILGALLHGDTTQVRNNLLVRILARNNACNLLRKRIYSIVHSHTLTGILMILVDYRLAGKLTYTHDAVRMVHTILLDAINRGINLST